MPFGLIFAALFFFLCAWLGLQFVSEPGLPAKTAGVLLTFLGLGLALGLLMRRPWARWGGMLCAVGLVLFGAWRVNTSGAMIDFLVLITALATAALLLVPATGDVRRGADRSLPADGGEFSRVLGWATAVSALGLAAATLWVYRAYEPAPVEATLPAVLTQRVSWTDYGDGLQRARSEGKPVLVNFIANWCGYCTKMDRTTWKHPGVIERLDEVVAVRVDIDDAREVNGYSGSGLAGRYGIDGTPTTLLVDRDGTVVSRAGGYQTTQQFLHWLDSSLSRTPGGPLTVAGP